jgi:tRNA 5-methylaminomethyl-2-thiouridine biosynthesis bifunctional protein
MNDSPLDWTDDGQPRSRLFGDVYFSAQDGLAESRAVFLKGCGLPERWAGRRRFTVAELGFGTGLNILALLDLWRREGPPDGHLHVFSVEGFPITADEAAQALGRWPELADLASLLVGRWPGRAGGMHRVDLPELRATLDLAVMEVEPGLSGWDGVADAWFLDGFSPALNPQMWSDEVLSLVAARSAPGARAATFTVAGAVRRGLSAAGFAVDKQPGFGRKRERLEARLPGNPLTDEPIPHVAVIGAGIAGAAAARALRALGARVTVIDRDGMGAGASGNPAALVTPRLDAGLGPPARLFAQAFARAVALYEAHPGAVISRGVLQRPGSERDPARFVAIAGSDLFEPGGLSAGPEGLDQANALVVEPAPILDAWAGEVLRARVAALEKDVDGWIVRDAAGEGVLRADAVVVAAGLEARALAAAPLSAVRGQATWTAAVAFAGQAQAWGGYVLPLRSGLLFGATHDRDDEAVDVRDADHARNLETLAQALPSLASELEGLPLQGRASIRATTADRLPLAGPAPEAPEGLWILGGFGSRGFSLAPLLGEHLAARIAGAPSPLPLELSALVDPARFAKRQAQRNRS